MYCVKNILCHFAVCLFFPLFLLLFWFGSCFSLRFFFCSPRACDTWHKYSPYELNVWIEILSSVFRKVFLILLLIYWSFHFSVDFTPSTMHACMHHYRTHAHCARCFFPPILFVLLCKNVNRNTSDRQYSWSLCTLSFLFHSCSSVFIKVIISIACFSIGVVRVSHTTN